MGPILRINPLFLELIRKKKWKIRDVPSYNLFQFKDEWTQFSPFSEFIEKLIRHVRIHSFMRWIVFLEFSENNGKSGKDYT